ncbi:MAG: hypothetical protein J7500_00680 [Sphingomonas sp.]|uniref:hypothetical protein n=1 Tax=Sphingomonas sp. TaxID=28214 RepID=UPI001B05B38A|nr:hypothetical protein [Sphingomonas sp.]MBO9621203.1 hypothetical protein [Sphingomonas sp.]
MLRSLGFFLFVFLPLALAGCGSRTGDQLSDEELGNAVDPAVASALNDPIMVDPALGVRANSDAIRPPAQPYSGALPADTVAANNGKVELGKLLHAPAPVPAAQGSGRNAVTLGGLAAHQKDRRAAACAGTLQYSATWAQRLPADLPLFPQARVTEAGGAQGSGCALRVVSFSAPQPLATLVDWYYTRAVRAGYTAEHQLDGETHVLGGTRKRDDGAYVVFLAARDDGGTDVDLIANNGT